MDNELHFMIRCTARSFAEAEIRPAASALDAEEAFPAVLYKRMAELGLFGVTLPEADGGIGADTRSFAIIMEEVGRGYAGLADELGNVEMIGSLLSEVGTTAQKVRYLAPLLAGEKVSAFAISEAEAGSDVSAIRTRAERQGSGWRLDGEKIWIHNGPNFDFAVVLAITDPSRGRRGMSIFLVDQGLPGVTCGRREHKMGQRSSQVGPIAFEHVELPAEALLGQENRGFHMMMSCLDRGRVGIAGMCVGMLQAALDAAVGQAKARRQFGQAIAEFQGIQFLLADIVKDLHAARALTYEAADALDSGADVTLRCSIAKCFASDALVARTSDALQIFGGSGYIRGFEVERLYRDARITQIFEGTNQIQRVIIARQLLA